MLELRNGLTLYHGSYCEVKEPDLDKCYKEKDFGKGFYLTTSKEQAKSFLNTSVAKAITKGVINDSQDYGYISVFNLELNEELCSCIFSEANIDWLHCVTAHRKRNTFNELEKNMTMYDVIVGKIADDQTNATLVAYIGGAFGQIGSKEADEFCIRQLLPNKLQDQYCFRTEKALKCLKYIESEKIWLKK
ncbi:MAG: DUF3990 domain-containing protein [Saccharofermentans sp.]|nr:DUF3990 domain-containing protein [Saccharofermentans sp.]